MTVILATTEFGGHEKMLIEWLKEASCQGIRIDVFCRNIPELIRQCAVADLNVDAFEYGTPARRRLLKFFHDVIATFGILRKMRRGSVAMFAPGVVQAAPWLILVAALCRRRVAAYVPMAYPSRTMHFRFALLRDWIVRQVIRSVDVWITITEQQRELLRNQWEVTAPVYVVPNRLRLQVAAVEGRAGQMDEVHPIRVLFLGRFERNQKGLDWLAGVLRQYQSSWVGRMRFVFQGQGEYEYALRELAQEVEGAVSIAPWGDALPEIQQADVLLLPSRFEGFPLVAVEATYYGLPVVASDYAGLSDVLPPECLFAFGDFEAMSKAIERMRNPVVRASAVAYARTCLETLLSKDRFEYAVCSVMREFAGAVPTNRVL